MHPVWLGGARHPATGDLREVRAHVLPLWRAVHSNVFTSDLEAVFAFQRVDTLLVRGPCALCEVAFKHAWVRELPFLQWFERLHSRAYNIQHSTIAALSTQVTPDDGVGTVCI